MRLRRLLLCVAGATAAMLVITASSAPAPGRARSDADVRSKIVDLGTLGGSSYATAVNGRGQVIGMSRGHAFLWTHGRLRDLGDLRGAVGRGAVGINNRGEVVLTRNTRSRHARLGPAYHAFLWRKGKLVDLGTVGRDLGGDMASLSEAVAINDRGEALANSSVNQNAPVSTAFVWRDGKRTAVTRTTDSVGTAINERGQVAGWIGSDLGFGRGQAFLWSKGRSTHLFTLRGRQYSWATALNDRGAVVGYSYDLAADGRQVRTRAFLWQHGKISDLGTLGGRTASAVAINSHGQIVGCSATRSGREHAFLWQRGKTTDLGSCTDTLAINERGDVLVSSGVWRHGTFIRLGTLGGKKSGANAINERGQIVGWSMTRAGKVHAALWTLRTN